MIRHCTVLVPCFISTETEKQNVIRHSASSLCKSTLVPSVHIDRSECKSRHLGVFCLLSRCGCWQWILCLFLVQLHAPMPQMSLMSHQPALCLLRWLVSGKPSFCFPPHCTLFPPRWFTQRSLRLPASLSSKHHPPLLFHLSCTDQACVRGRSYSTQPFSGLSQPRNHHTVTVWKRRKWLYYLIRMAGFYTPHVNTLMTNVHRCPYIQRLFLPSMHMILLLAVNQPQQFNAWRQW